VTTSNTAKTVTTNAHPNFARVRHFVYTRKKIPSKTFLFTLVKNIEKEVFETNKISKFLVSQT
jgi:hypothetical protein